MNYLIGTDEAGYGPNLGPLLISATVWRVPDGVRCGDLAERLAGVIVPTPSQVSADGGPYIAIGDSKVLYQSGKGLRHLERGLWTAMRLLGHRPCTWREVWDVLSPEAACERDNLAWHAGYDPAVPLDADLASLDSIVPAVGAALECAGVELMAMRSCAVFPETFNRLVNQQGSKGSVLSNLTLQLAAEMIRPLGEATISVVCDKHGGRSRYRDLLETHFPDYLIEIHGEGRELSTYRFGPAARRIEFRFQTKAEAYLPTALASMASKYLRELAMGAWNAFWCSRVAGLQPTAGYPEDAKRFKAQIAAVQAELGIEDGVIWRER